MPLSRVLFLQLETGTKKTPDTWCKLKDAKVEAGGWVEQKGRTPLPRVRKRAGVTVRRRKGCPGVPTLSFDWWLLE